MELSNCSFDQLVEEIIAINRGWKIACNLFDGTSPLATSLRDLKTCKQIHLLETYGPEKVYLALDTTALGEPLYGLILREPVVNRYDADHLPVRLAEEILAPEELKRLIQENNLEG